MPDIGRAEAAAIKAVSRGDASPEQQKRALDWVIKKACQIGGVSFSTDPYLTAFNEGKRFVGLMLVSIVNEPTDSFRE